MTSSTFKKVNTEKRRKNSFKKHTTVVGLSMALILGSQVSHALSLSNGGAPPSSGSEYGGFFGGLFDPVTALADFDYIAPAPAGTSSDVQMDWAENITSASTSANVIDEITITGDVAVYFTNPYTIPAGTEPYIAPTSTVNTAIAPVIFTYNITYLDDLTTADDDVIITNTVDNKGTATTTDDTVDIQIQALSTADFTGTFTYANPTGDIVMGVTGEADESACTGPGGDCVLELAIPPSMFLDGLGSLTSVGNLIFDASVYDSIAIDDANTLDLIYAHATYCHAGTWDVTTIDMSKCNEHVGLLVGGQSLNPGEFAVPEPGSLALMSLGLLGLVMRVRRKEA